MPSPSGIITTCRISMRCSACSSGTSQQLHDAEAVRLAIFYHDAIYQPERPDNEAASAGQLMRDELWAVWSMR